MVTVLERDLKGILILTIRLACDNSKLFVLSITCGLLLMSRHLLA